MNIRLKLEIQRFLVNYIAGFLIYLAIEAIYRTITGQVANENAYINLVLMGNLGGIVLNIIGNFDRIKWFNNLAFKVKCLIGGLIISACEFIAGLIINKWLHLEGWDYMNNFLGPLFLGQTCFRFIIIWILASPFVYWVDSCFDEMVWLYNNVLRQKDVSTELVEYTKKKFMHEVNFYQLAENYKKLLFYWGAKFWVK